jgi:cell division protein FtsA
MYMNRTEYVAALDIGTSKIVAMAARKNENGTMSILASEKEDPENSIRRGYIYNADVASNKISRVTRKLSEQLKSRSHAPIDKIYVGIGGQSIHTVWHSITKEIKEERVTRELLNEIDREICQYEIELVEILEILPPEFYLDGRLEDNPKGTSGAVIEARYPLIVNNRFLKRSLISALDKINIAGFNIIPIATAEAVLTGENKEAGCVLVELGAGITYLSIYKGGRLKHLVTIPLGSSVITMDIANMNIPEKEAEELKIKYGNARIEYDSDGSMISTPEIAQREELKNFDRAIEARSIEIIANIKKQIEQSGYSKATLGAGIIITGGGASLRNIRESIEQETGIRVSIAKNRYLCETEAEIAAQPEYTTITGLLALSKVNCAKETAPKPQKPDIFDNTPGDGSTGNPVDKNKESGKKTGKATKKEVKKEPKETKKNIVQWFIDSASKTLFENNDNDNTEK